MKKLRNEKVFTVQEEQLDEQQQLALGVLVQEVTASSELILNVVNDLYSLDCTLYKLRLLDNIALGDKVIVRSRIIKYNGSSLSLKVNVYKIVKEQELCTAIALFTYDLMQKNTKLAS
jgi:hypothetical protein